MKSGASGRMASSMPFRQWQINFNVACPSGACRSSARFPWRHETTVRRLQVGADPRLRGAVLAGIGYIVATW
jgi:hypothetical protein